MAPSRRRPDHYWNRIKDLVDNGPSRSFVLQPEVDSGIGSPRAPPLCSHAQCLSGRYPRRALERPIHDGKSVWPVERAHDNRARQSIAHAVRERAPRRAEIGARFEAECTLRHGARDGDDQLALPRGGTEGDETLRARLNYPRRGRHEPGQPRGARVERFAQDLDQTPREFVGSRSSVSGLTPKDAENGLEPVEGAGIRTPRRRATRAPSPACSRCASTASGSASRSKSCRNRASSGIKTGTSEGERYPRAPSTLNRLRKRARCGHRCVRCDHRYLVRSPRLRGAVRARTT